MRLWKQAGFDIDGKIKHVMQKVNTRTHHDDVLALVKEINK